MTFDVHAHCIPPSFRSWLERSEPAHGAELLDTARGTCVQFDHVLVGTDYPFEMGDDALVALIDSVPRLERTQREAILSGNARRLFG